MQPCCPLTYLLPTSYLHLPLTEHLVGLGTCWTSSSVILLHLPSKPIQVVITTVLILDMKKNQDLIRVLHPML